MKNINKMYKFIGKYLVSNIQSEDWKRIVLNMEINDRYRSFQGAYFDCMDAEHDLGIIFSIEFGEKIKEFYLFTKENNFAPWNRAVYTPNWGQELRELWATVLQLIHFEVSLYTAFPILHIFAFLCLSQFLKMENS